MRDAATAYCPRCGAAEGSCAPACAERHRLDPDRFCRSCGRRLRVQVLPDGVVSRCKVCDLRARGVLPRR